MGFAEKTPEKQLISCIANTWLAIKYKAREMLAEMEYDLTFEQIMILHILCEQEGQNLGTVAEKADRERTTISRMVDGLEKRNLVVRVPDKTDKRQKLLYLTPLGKERVAAMAPMGERMHQDIYKNIDEKDVKCCLEILKRMFGNLEKK